MCLQGAKAEEVQRRGTWREGGGGRAWAESKRPISEDARSNDGNGTY